MKSGLLGALATVLIAAVVCAVVVLSGVVNVGADDPVPGFVESLLHTTMERSVASRTSDIDVPDLDDPELVVEGAEHYDSMCVHCHGAPGVEPGEIAQGLHPTPPELASDGPRDPATLFWVTKHGVMMTGMPAWGTSHEDESIWGMVALMKRFPQMTGDQYAALVARSEGEHGGDGHHHEGGHGHDEGRRHHDHDSHEH